MSATGKHFLQRHLSSHLEGWNHLKPFHAYPCCFHHEHTVTAFVKDTKSSRVNIGKRKVTSHNSDLSCSFNTVDFDMYVFISLFLSLYIFMCNPDLLSDRFGIRGLGLCSFADPVQFENFTHTVKLFRKFLQVPWRFFPSPLSSW